MDRQWPNRGEAVIVRSSNYMPLLEHCPHMFHH